MSTVFRMVIVLEALLATVQAQVAIESYDRFCTSREGEARTCYYYFPEAKAQYDAEQACSRYGTILFYPRTRAESNNAKDFMTAFNYNKIWINALELRKSWGITLDGYSAPWVPERPQDDDHYMACVMMSSVEDFRWDHVPCTQFNAFMCQLEPEECSDHEERDDKLLVNDDYCYVIKADYVKTWYQARMECAEMGGTLPVIRDQALHDSIARYLQQQAISRNIWLADANRKWVNKDVTELNFFNWMEGEPDQEFEDCAQMLSSGQWLDSKCDPALPYICVGSGPDVRVPYNPAGAFSTPSTAGSRITTVEGVSPVVVVTGQPPSDSTLLIGIIAGSLGALVLIIIVLVIVCVRKRRAAQRATNGSPLLKRSGRGLTPSALNSIDDGKDNPYGSTMSSTLTYPEVKDRIAGDMATPWGTMQRVNYLGEEEGYSPYGGRNDAPIGATSGTNVRM